MVTSFFILAVIRIAFGAEPAYQYLNIPLPGSLAGHISAIYNNELYVFGGANATVQGSSASFQNKFWKLPLNKISLSGTNDISSTLTSSDWVSLTVAAPAYGDSTNNEFFCENQCSVVIGKYLYIVGPYSSASSSLLDLRSDIYRLDLSQDPPVFSAQSAFVSTVNYQTDTSKHCVTAVDDILYILSGAYGVAGSVEGVKYDPSSNTQTALSDMPLTDTFYEAGRSDAGCAGNVAGDAIYLFGGRGKRFTYGAPGVDTYDITNDVWTENSATVEFDKSNGANGANSRKQMKCFNKYSRAAECVGGFGIAGGVAAAKNNAIIWNYDDKNEEYVTLPTGVFAAGVNVYEILNNGNNAASVVLVTGGFSSVSAYTATGSIQYAVRYVTITSEPTESPITPPSVTPTPAPSRSPLCTGCTHEPSASPTGDPTKGPTTTTEASSPSSEGSVVKLWTVVTFMVIMISAVIYV